MEEDELREDSHPYFFYFLEAPQPAGTHQRLEGGDQARRKTP